MIYNNTNYTEIHREIPGQCWKCKNRSYKICDLTQESCIRTAPVCKPTSKGGHRLLITEDVLWKI